MRPNSSNSIFLFNNDIFNIFLEKNYYGSQILASGKDRIYDSGYMYSKSTKNSLRPIKITCNFLLILQTDFLNSL